MKMMLEKKKERFNLITKVSPRYPHAYVILHLQNRRSWDDGLSCPQLINKVKSGLKSAGSKRWKSFRRQYIYDAITSINQFSEPPFYISKSCRRNAEGKFEWRYFVPVVDNDVQEEIRRIRHGVEIRYRKEANLREFEDKEIPLEQKQIELQKGVIIQ